MRKHLLPLTVILLGLAVLATLWVAADQVRKAMVPTRHVWEIQAIKPDGDQIELAPGWEILGYDRAVGVVYIKRMVEGVN